MLLHSMITVGLRGTAKAFTVQTIERPPMTMVISFIIDTKQFGIRGSNFIVQKWTQLPYSQDSQGMSVMNKSLAEVVFVV